MEFPIDVNGYGIVQNEEDASTLMGDGVIVTINGKLYFSENPDIVRTADYSVYEYNMWHLKSDCFINSLGAYEHKRNSIEYEGSLYSVSVDDIVTTSRYRHDYDNLPKKIPIKMFIQTPDGRLWKKDDDRIVRVHNRKMWHEKSRCVLLSQEHYGEDAYELQEFTAKLDDGSVVSVADISYVLNDDGNDLVIYGHRFGRSAMFKSRVSKSCKAMITGFSKTSYGGRNVSGTSSFMVNDTVKYTFEYYNGKRDLINVSKLINHNTYMLPEMFKYILRHGDSSYFYVSNEHYARRLCSLMNDDPNGEISAAGIDVAFSRPRGGQLLRTFHARPSIEMFGDNQNPDISESRRRMIPNTYSMLGGIKYNFGIELETAWGFAKKDDLVGLNVKTYSDGSIRGEEFVTGVLCGDRGIEELVKIVEGINKHCWVDRSNAQHVHLSGESIVMNRSFSINMIKLAWILEPDMFNMQPKSRNPLGRYCATIALSRIRDDVIGNQCIPYGEDYKDVFTTPMESLSRYVYGHDKFSKEINSKQELGRWVNSRYKWLNLVNANSVSRFSTVEFRQFAGTTNVKKVIYNLRIAVAFTWYANNKAHKLEPTTNLSLTDVIEEAYSRHPEIHEPLNEYVYQRTKEFKRKLYK